MLRFKQYLKEAPKKGINRLDDGSVAAVSYKGTLYHADYKKPEWTDEQKRNYQGLEDPRTHHIDIIHKILKKHKIPKKDHDTEAEKMGAHFYQPELRRSAKQLSFDDNNDDTSGYQKRKGKTHIETNPHTDMYKHRFKKFTGKIERIPE